MGAKFETSGGYPGGFVATIDGYSCFIEPDFKKERWNWFIQSGGGWAGVRGGHKVKQHAEGSALSAESAEKKISEWIDSHEKEKCNARYL